jgi:hypothetical protein
MPPPNHPLTTHPPTHLSFYLLQVLSGCTDPRVCLFVSQFMLEHLMQHQQDRYWTALRQLVSTAQQANDERLLGNPFLQLVTLLSDTQQKQPSGPKGPFARV